MLTDEPTVTEMQEWDESHQRKMTLRYTYEHDNMCSVCGQTIRGVSRYEVYQGLTKRGVVHLCAGCERHITDAELEEALLT